MEHARPYRFHSDTDGLEALCRDTKFSRREIQLMYRSFKQVCPSGFVDEDAFKQIFSQFFPYGNASLYAHYVFKTFDQNRNGAIRFKDFLHCLSLLCRGSPRDKLRWAFSLYDINGDGCITKKEMTDIVCSVYALLGRRSHPAVDEKSLRDHVDRIFLKMDLNKDGVVTIDEFMEICTKDETISKSLSLFDTVL
ncbi:A-type potassium channel modulatory protein KCNIP2-like [Tachypleus tridentatus]|uniref:A-type potassium channel modulatory protein KCNIP2-like n=1 Tax=Tachypleus tridentatus TaxID=6853 RepID=UPI003FD16B45